MKKTFTLLMALAFMTSLVAMPVLPTQLVLGTQSQKVQLLQQKAQQLQAQKDVKIQKQQIAKQQKIRRAPMADGTTFTYTSISDTAQTKDGITVKLAKGSGQNAPAWNDKSSHLRMYANNTITVSATGITKVELTCSKTASNKTYAEMTAGTGKLVSGGESTAVGESKTDTWTGDVDKVVFTLGASGQRVIEKIVVTLGGQGGGGGGGEEEVTISGLTQAYAIYYEDSEAYYWDFDLAAEFGEEDTTYPELYYMCDDEASSKTSIVGTYAAYYAMVWTSAKDSVGTDEDEPVGTMTVTYVEEGVYNFAGSFVGTDGNTYKWNATNVVVAAFDADNDYEVIELDEEGGSGSENIYEIDFTAGQGEWTIDNVQLPESLTYVWKQDSKYGMKATAFVSSTAYEAESWLISPEIDLTDVTEATLKVNQALNKAANTNLRVKISTDGGETWEDLDLNLPEGKSWDFQEDEVDLSDYAGEKIMIAFVYVSTTSVCPTWEISSVVITGEGGGTPVEAIEVDMNGNIEVSSMSFLGYYFYDIAVEAQNDSIDFYASLSPYGESEIDIYSETFTQADGEVAMWLNGDSLAVSSFKLTFSQSADTTIAKALVQTADAAYQLNIKYFVPQAKDTVVIDFEDVAMVENYSDYGMYLIEAMNADYGFVQAIYADELEGEYTKDDMEAMYTMLVVIDGADTTSVKFFDINTEIVNVDDTFLIATNYFGKDTVLYQINMWYALPAAKDTVNMNFTDANLVDGTTDYSAVMVVSEGEGQNSLSVYINTDNVEGTYTLADIEQQYTYLLLINGTDTTEVSFLDMQAVVTKTDEEHATVTIAALGSDTVFYNINVTATIEIYENDPYEYDEAANVNKTYTKGVDQVEWDTSYFTEDGYIGLEVTSASGTEYAALAFYSEANPLPAGVYEINDSYAAPSAMMSPGLEDSYVYPSFFSLLDAEGYIESVWFMVEGTITVSDTAVVVDAINSKGNSVKLTINLTSAPTPSEHTIVIEDYQDTAFVTKDGLYEITTYNKGGNASAYNATSKDLRVYSNATFEITSSVTMTEMVFNLSNKGKQRQAELTVNTGNVAYDVTNGKVTWTGNASNVTFLVGATAKYGSDGESKAGHFDFTSIDITTKETGLQTIKSSESISKFIMNSQLFIQKNGVLYNAQGQVIK